MICRRISQPRNPSSCKTKPLPTIIQAVQGTRQGMWGLETERQAGRRGNTSLPLTWVKHSHHSPHRPPCPGPWEASEWGCTGLETGVKAPQVRAVPTPAPGKLLLESSTKIRWDNNTVLDCTVWTCAFVSQKCIWEFVVSWHFRKKKPCPTLLVTYKCKTLSNGRGF